mmetsp:Transcript_710/g.886  ORF Transcript_710/g.886 Transcript_710/m.886 type:complete len:118 (+) Transcript_710:88-441(+)
MALVELAHRILLLGDAEKEDGKMKEDEEDEEDEYDAAKTNGWDRCWVSEDAKPLFHGGTFRGAAEGEAGSKRGKERAGGGNNGPRGVRENCWGSDGLPGWSAGIPPPTESKVGLRSG